MKRYLRDDNGYALLYLQARFGELFLRSALALLSASNHQKETSTIKLVIEIIDKFWFIMSFIVPAVKRRH